MLAHQSGPATPSISFATALDRRQSQKYRAKAQLLTHPRARLRQWSWSLAFVALTQLASACGGTGYNRPTDREILITGPKVRAVIRADTPLQATLNLGPEQAAEKTDDYPLFVQAQQHNATVFDGQQAKMGRGLLRYGAATKARPIGPGARCPGGSWYEVRDGGFVCTSLGFRTLDSAPSDPDASIRPNIRKQLPYRYVKLVTKPAPRLSRLPSSTEAAELAELRSQGAQELSGLPFVRDILSSIHFLAVTNEVTADDGTAYFRTVRGDYIRAQDVETVSAVPMQGESLDHGLNQPLGFIVGPERVPVFRIDAGQAQAVGWGERFGRRAVRERITLSNRAYWILDDDLAVEEAHLRIAKRISRPAGISASERWLHINLPQQTLVAYRGDDPVYATLVSTGKAGHETPTGLFHIRHKYISITMSGSDPVDGDYEIEEVPWTHYYQGSYAIHAAFWHTDFGQVRSHGCTNVAPADAHWLYHFTAPHVPQGWHGVWEPGTAVYITGEEGAAVPPG